MPALVTPFDRSGEIRLSDHRHNLRTLWDAGVRGYLIAGSTGEGPYLEPGERRQLLEAARSELGSKAFLLCGVAAETTRQAMAMVKEAGFGGADGALVITPTTLARNRHRMVEDFYLGLAEASPLPIWIYTVPAVTAYELPLESVLRVAEHPNVAGIKDSGGHPVRFQAMAAAAGPDFHLYSGASAAITLAIEGGARGAITASTNYAPRQVLRTVEAARRRSSDSAKLQADLVRLTSVVEAYGVPGVKAAARSAGMRPGVPRLPLVALPSKESKRVVAALTPV
jgi:dihydrodipicolinate synthase/N-acetylneuraminate lyase